MSTIERIAYLLALSRFEAKACAFAIEDKDSERARNHAVWSARHARAAVALLAAY